MARKLRQTRKTSLAAAGLVLLAVCGGGASPMVSSQAADRAPSARKGLKVAREWCTRCHVVRRGRKRRAGSEVPSFQEVANRPGMTPAKLRRILGRPHNQMPTEPLYTDEVADLIAYIRSLRRR